MSNVEVQGTKFVEVQVHPAIAPLLRQLTNISLDDAVECFTEALIAHQDKQTALYHKLQNQYQRGLLTAEEVDICLQSEKPTPIFIVNE